MVKTSNKGFTLVELMIVIAIIGVLAAALFPMMRGYLEKSRDTARISHLGQLRTVVQSYLQDTGIQPVLSATGSPTCVGDPGSGSGVEIAANLNGGMVPADPVLGRTATPCNSIGAGGSKIAGKGLYGYVTGQTSTTNNAFFIISRVESSQSATTGSLAFENGDASGSTVIDALLQIHGQKGLAASKPTSANNSTGTSVDYGVYIIGGMN